MQNTNRNALTHRKNYRNSDFFFWSSLLSLIFFFQTEVPSQLSLITIAMIHEYFKYLFLYFSSPSIKLMSLRTRNWNKIVFLRVCH